MSQKLYALTEEAALLNGRAASATADAGGTPPTLGPWQTELLRSQSVDAVHTSKQGQVRSNHWRRNQTNRIWSVFKFYYSELIEEVEIVQFG